MGSNGRNGNKAHLEIVPFEVNDATEGYMVFPGSPPAEIDVERSADNDHLFMFNHAAERFEVLCYGSALIVSLLRMHEPGYPPSGNKIQAATNERELAMFDTGGNFHDHLLLREPLLPRETDSTLPGVKHTAFFDQLADGERWPLNMAIDDIYMLSLAKPASI